MAAHFATPIAPPSSRVTGGFKPNQALPTNAVPVTAISQEDVRKGLTLGSAFIKYPICQSLNMAVESRPTALEMTP